MTDHIRVLYVDDEPELLELGKIFLEDPGEISIETTDSAPAAFSLLERSSFDAIISDYLMPEMDGITFLKTIRSRGDETPFIIFTGNGREEVVIEALNAGANCYLQKGSNLKAQFREIGQSVKQAVDRHRADVALRESYAFNRNLLDNLPEYLVVCGKDRKVKYVNPTAIQILGPSLDEITECDLLDFVPEMHHDDLTNCISQILSGENLPSLEIEIFTRGQKSVPVIVKGACIQCQEELAVSLLLTDITARKELELELAAHIGQLSQPYQVVNETNNKLISFGNILSHNILNELTVVQGYIDLARMESDPVVLKEFYENVDRATERIEQIIRFNKDYQNLVISKPVWHDVRTIVESGIAGHMEGAISFTSEIGPYEVYANPFFEHVVSGLIENTCIPAMHMNQMQFYTRKHSEDLCIIAEGNGSGIPIEEKEMIFNYNKWDDKRYSLFLLREMLSLTGITITENGVPESGSRFNIAVPKGVWRDTLGKDAY